MQRNPETAPFRHIEPKRLIPALTIALLLFSSAGKAFAWNAYGHMVVASVAYRHLQPSTKARVMQLLRLNPYFESWKKEIGSLPEDTFNERIFMMAATWPDDIKGDSSFVKDGEAGGWRPSGPSASENTGYGDKNLHMYWHFCDQGFSNDGTKLPVIPSPNALTQLQTFRTVLASNASDELKSYDLTWIIHLLGDIHQPLHSSARVSSIDPEGDNGGNFVKLKSTENGSNLHAFWDNAIGGGSNFKIKPDPAKVIDTSSHLKKADKASSQNLDANAWVQESSKLAKSSVYKSIKEGHGPFNLSPSYKRDAKILAAKQAELAGERLANLLNNELK